MIEGTSVAYSIQNITSTVRSVKKGVEDFVGEAEQFDDMTMLLMEYKGIDGEVNSNMNKTG